MTNGAPSTSAPAAGTSGRPGLWIAWASHDAAEYACRHWHYSGVLPVGKMVRIGVWEDGVFAGVVLFSRGAAPHLPTRYGLTQMECVELTRVALREHRATVSKIVALAIRFLRRFCPGLRLIVSFADPNQGHHGGIYQAGNWIYTGQSAPAHETLVDGRWRHPRTVGVHPEWKGLPRRPVPGKHRYLYPLDDGIRAQVETLRQPYPKKSGDSMAAHAPGDHPGDGGPTPTSPLQNSPSTT